MTSVDIFKLDSPEEDRNVSIEKDFNSYRDIHITLHNTLSFEDKLLVYESYLQKFNEIQSKSKLLKICNNLDSTCEDFKATWHNSSYINNIKFWAVPSFLIVEVNSKLS